MKILSATSSQARMAAAVLLWAIAAAGVGPADAQPAATLRIVATTSLIAEIASDLGGPAVEVVTLIPPASCPGHFDIKPGDMRMLSDAHLFFLHGWQGRMFSDGILRASGNHGLKKVVLEVPGNWMTPSAQIAATDRIAALLAEIDPARAATYRAAAARRSAEVERVGAAQAQRIASANVGRAAVMANAMQVDFVRWAGLHVVGDFGRGEDMSPRDMEEAIRLGRSQAVRLVVDNLQSGRQAGIGIANEIGAAQVTLSNFPGGFEGTASWAKAIERNVDLLIAAINR